MEITVEGTRILLKKKVFYGDVTYEGKLNRYVFIYVHEERNTWCVEIQSARICQDDYLSFYGQGESSQLDKAITKALKEYRKSYKVILTELTKKLGILKSLAL